MTPTIQQRFYIFLAVFALFSFGYQRYYEYKMDKVILEEQERANKIAQRNHELYLKVMKENNRLKNENRIGH